MIYGRICVLQEENDSLKCQLQVYKNEVDLVKSDLKSDADIKDQQIKVLQETIRNMQTQLLDNKAKEKETGQRMHELEERLKSANVKELLLKTKIAATSAKNRDVTCPVMTPIAEDQQSSGADALSSLTTVAVEATNHSAVADPNLNLVKVERLDGDEARIISLVSTFLVVHPFGASTDYIWSYVNRIAPKLRPKGLEELLVRHSGLFAEEITGVGAQIERKWKFCGFDATDT